MKNNQIFQKILFIIGNILIFTIVFWGCKSPVNCVYCMEKQTTYINGKIVNTRWLVNDSLIFGNSINFDSSMNITSIIPYEFDEFQGILQDFDSLGNLTSISSWVAGTKAGPFIKFNNNGSPKSIYYYKNNMLNGNAYWHDSTGKLLRYMYFNDYGHLVFAVNYNASSISLEGDGILKVSNTPKSKVLNVNETTLFQILIARPPGFTPRVLASTYNSFNEKIKSELIVSGFNDQISYGLNLNISGKYSVVFEYQLLGNDEVYNCVSNYTVSNIIIN